jgi:hypothetical protein
MQLVEAREAGADDQRVEGASGREFTPRQAVLVSDMIRSPPLGCG